MNTLAMQFDDKAVKLAKDYLLTEGQLLLLFCEMRKKRVFAELNYSGVFDYCLNRLRLSKAQSYYFSAVAEKAEVVPEIREAVVQGDLTLSQARRIVSVVTPQNHTEWIQKACTLSQVELEKEVTRVNPNAMPREVIKPIAPEVSELRTPIHSKTEEDLKILKDLLSQKLGKPASLAEVIAWATSECREKHDPIKKAQRSKSLGFTKPALPGRHPIPAKVKHAVVTRDNRQCTHQTPDGRRCQERRWLQAHHRVEVAQGGLNEVENLHLLCFAHHRRVHHKKCEIPFRIF